MFGEARSAVLKLEPLAEGIEHAVDRHPGWVLATVSVLYLASTIFVASRRLMWNDELYTYYLATLPRVSDLWPALMTGAEQIPPSFHLVTRAVLRALGANHVSIRLSAMVGVLIALLCVYRFVARRTSAFYGVIALLFCLATRAYQYGYEARPYGLLLGFSGLALVTWQAATSDGGDRRPALVSLTLSLAAALACHYYAVLVFATLGIGEVVRSASRRRVDPPVWIALGVAAIGPLLAFAPLILSSRQYAGTFWSPVRLRDVPWVYMELLNAGMLPLALTGLMAAGCAMFRGPYADEPPRRPPPIHEVAAAVAFVALPLIAFVIAKVVTRAFVGRYALPAVIGFSSVVALALYALPRGRALTGTALILALGGSFVVGYRDTIRDVRADARTTLDDIQMLEHQSDPRLAIVASEPHVFMVLAHYAPAA